MIKVNLSDSSGIESFDTIQEFPKLTLFRVVRIWNLTISITISNKDLLLLHKDQWIISFDCSFFYFLTNQLRLRLLTSWPSITLPTSEANQKIMYGITEFPQSPIAHRPSNVLQKLSALSVSCLQKILLDLDKFSVYLCIKFYCSEGECIWK